MQRIFISAKVFLTFLFVISLNTYGEAQSSAPKTKEEFRRKRDMDDFAVSICVKSPNLDNLLRKTLGKDSLRKNYFYRTLRLSDSDFASLTVFEKFIYAHEYPESYMQNCSWYNFPDGLSKLYANLPFITTGLKMSKRQLESVKNNRDSAIKYMDDCVKKQDYLALGYKQTILDLNAWEFIPLILQFEAITFTAKDKLLQDAYLYTLLVRLMKDNEFSDFKNTSLYTKLYGPKTYYKETIDFTPQVREEVIDLANKFYLSKLSETK